MERFTLGYSPCPNDTFIFYALVHHKIDTEDIAFDVVLEDVETLNIWANHEKLDITKISFAQYFNCFRKYILLNSGSALGNNCGPILVCKHEDEQNIKPVFLANESQKLNALRIAIPGENTTANFLLKYAYGKHLSTIEMPFHAIEYAVLNQKVDAGLLIHENRFTYKDKGLDKICDLGEYWEQNTGYKIPLGGICIRRSIDNDKSVKISKLIKKSIEYAYANPSETMQYVKKFAQEMDENVMQKHINLYVNTETMELTAEGKNAVLFMQKFLLAETTESVFVK